MNNLEIMGTLGKGSFAEVFLVKNKLDNQIYALKQIILSKIPKSEQESALNEVRILASIEHPNIIDFKEVFIDENTKSLNIVMEYASDKDLLSKIKYFKIMNKMISEDVIWDYLIQIILGLKILHEKKIIHRDLKSANVFISGNIVKIGDFNISKVVKTAFVVSSQTGTPYYASPEVWSEKPYDYKTDIWSLGCIIYELCCFRPPFLGMTADELFKNVLKGKFDSIPKIYSNELSMIISKMLMVNRDKRPDTVKLLADPIVMQKYENFTNKINYYGNQLDVEMLNTIKFSYCLNELSKNLPKINRYNCKSRSSVNVLTFKNNLAFDEQSRERKPNYHNKEKSKEKSLTPIKNKGNGISEKSTSSNSITDKLGEGNSKAGLEAKELTVVQSEKKSDKISIPQSSHKIRSIITRKKLNENINLNNITDSRNILCKESKKACLNISKKVTVENIDVINQNEKVENKNIKKENKMIINKPAYSSRNVIIYKHDDLLNKKNHDLDKHKNQVNVINGGNFDEPKAKAKIISSNKIPIYEEVNKKNQVHKLQGHNDL